MSVLYRAVCAGCSECRSPDSKGFAPSCQIVKWPVNNKSPPELCPCSAVAGDAVHSNLGCSTFFLEKRHKNYEGLAPACQESRKMTHCRYGAVDPFYCKPGHLLFRTNLSGSIAAVGHEEKAIPGKGSLRGDCRGRSSE